VPNGCDVSEHQGYLDPEFFTEWDFVIMRAFNEHGRPDREFATNWAKAEGRTKRGAYGWPVPGQNNRALGQSLVNVAPGAELGYWADYEHSQAYGLATVLDLEDYLDGIGDHVKGFYSNVPDLPRSPALDAVPWWCANYERNDGQRHELSLPAPRPWQIHQFTSVPIDLNYAPNLDFARGRMATGQDLIDAAVTFLGEPYSTAPGRDDPTSGHKDCSGLIAASYAVATGEELGANVSVTIFDLCAKQGLEISLEDAVHTAGACLLKPDDPYVGWGPAGHIAFADGNGGTVEATPPRVQRLPLRYNAPWSWRACLLPGIDYGRTPPPTTPPEDTDMRSLLIHKPGEAIVYVYDAANGTKTKVASIAVLNGMKFLAGKTGLDVSGPDNGTYEADPAFIDGLPTIG
jgi:hypothetical protein